MKKIITGIIVLLLIALAVPVAYAAVSSDKQKEINDLNKQVFNLRKQIIDKNVEGGNLSPEQGKLAKERIDQRQQYIEENGGQVGPGLGRGACGGLGTGGYCQGIGAGTTGGVTQNNF